MPVIATNVGDISSAVINEYNGYLVKPGEIEELAQKIVQLCNKQKFEKYSANSIKFSREKFCNEKYFDTLVSIFKSVNKRAI